MQDNNNNANEQLDMEGEHDVHVKCNITLDDFSPAREHEVIPAPAKSWTLVLNGLWPAARDHN